MVRKMFWSNLCQADYPHARDMGNFKFHNSEHTFNQSRSKQLIYSTRLNVLNYHTESILEEGILPLSDGWSWFP
jgi:hypothetical protein